MDGADEWPELDAVYSQNFDHDLLKRRQVLEEAQRTVEHLKEKKQVFENADTMETVQLRIADLERKKQKHLQYAQQMEEHLSKKERSLEEKRAESLIVLNEAKRLRMEYPHRKYYSFSSSK